MKQKYLLSVTKSWTNIHTVIPDNGTKKFDVYSANLINTLIYTQI
jgi:hypothetical protein